MTTERLQPGTQFELTEVTTDEKRTGKILDLKRAFEEQGIMFPNGSQTPRVDYDFLFDDQMGKLGHLDNLAEVVTKDDGTIRLATRNAVYELKVLS